MIAPCTVYFYLLIRIFFFFLQKKKNQDILLILHCSCPQNHNSKIVPLRDWCTHRIIKERKLYLPKQQLHNQGQNRNHEGLQHRRFQALIITAQCPPNLHTFLTFHSLTIPHLSLTLRSTMTRFITDTRPRNCNRLMRSDPSWKPNPEGWKRNFSIENPLYMGKLMQ